ncbi:pentapeptide repeat-containing protein [Streptomyces sp. NBC_01549]
MRDARLSEVELAEAYLLKTNLNGAYLDKAEATKARLFMADLALRAVP